MFNELLNDYEKELEAFEATAFLEFTDIGPELNLKVSTQTLAVELYETGFSLLEIENFVTSQLL
jgi:hypothetical protein